MRISQSVEERGQAGEIRRPRVSYSFQALKKRSSATSSAIVARIRFSLGSKLGTLPDSELGDRTERQILIVVRLSARFQQAPCPEPCEKSPGYWGRPDARISATTTRVNRRP